MGHSTARFDNAIKYIGANTLEELETKVNEFLIKSTRLWELYQAPFQGMLTKSRVEWIQVLREPR